MGFYDTECFVILAEVSRSRLNLLLVYPMLQTYFKFGKLTVWLFLTDFAVLVTTLNSNSNTYT